MATNAPWYVRNTTIHTDIKIPLVNDLVKKTYDIHHRKMLLHVNPLIQEIALNPPQ